MNGRFLSSRYLRILTVVFVIAFVLNDVLGAKKVFTAPPTRRSTSSESVVNSQSGFQNPNQAKSASSESGSIIDNNKSKRQVSEVNKGELPETGSGEVNWSDDANIASNWFDEKKGAQLRSDALNISVDLRKSWPEFQSLKMSRAKSLRIRSIESDSQRVVLYTDLSSSEDTDSIPEALDLAIEKICDFYGISSKRFEKLKVEAFLMDNVNSFIEFGALDGPPRFLYGYSMGDRIYAKNQKSSYYNRFLLIHELVHTLMHEIFGDLRPRWFSEGSAEYLALHQWDSRRRKLEIAIIPESAEQTPGFGRLAQIQQLIKDNNVPTLLEILSFEPRDFVNISTYSWSWAFTMFLHMSPKYHEIAKMLPYWALADDPNMLFIDAVDKRWNELENDWADFIDRIDYLYDFSLTSIGDAIKKGSSSDLEKGTVVEIDAARGWQKTDVFVEAESDYRLVSNGRFMCKILGAGRFQFESPGATCVYVHGRPIGRLEVAVVPTTKDLTFEQTYGKTWEDSYYSLDKSARSYLRRFTGFPDPIDENLSDDSKTKRTTRAEFMDSSDTEKRKNKKASETESNSYNALFPWNESWEFTKSSITIKPRYDGKLYFRINYLSNSDLKENKGSVKIQIKKPENNQE